MLTYRNVFGWVLFILFGLPLVVFSQTVDTQCFLLKLHPDSTVVFDGNRNSHGALLTGLSAVDALNETHEAHLEKVFVDAADPPLSQYYYVRLLTAAKNIQGVSNAYNSLKAVDHTQLISEGQVASVNHPDDPYYNFTMNNNGNDDGLDQEQWHLYNDGDMNNDGTADGLTRADLHMPKAWAVQTGRSDVLLGIVDAGIRWTHEDLVNNMWINTEEDANGNGTFEDYPISQGGDFGDANGDGYPGVQGVDDDGDGYTDFNDPGVQNIYTNGLDDDGDGRTDDELGGEFDDSPGIVGFDDDQDGVVDDYDGAIYDDDENGYRDDVIGWDFYNWDPVPDPSFGHGTWVAGEAAADGDNGKGVTGVMQEAQILSAKVFQTPYSGRRFSSAVYYATNNGAHVINMSFEGVTISSAINYADNNNVVLVGAAGNSDHGVSWPAKNSKVIAVAGLTSYEEKHPNSNYGPEIDVCAYYAPTTGVARGSDSHYEDWGSGTSVSAPMVAGIAGLVISEELDNGNTSYTNDWVRTAIVSSADDVDQYNPNYQGDLGSGRANAFNAVAPPAAPQNLSVTGGTGNHPYVTWDDNSEPDLEGYHVFREDGGGVTQLTTSPIPNSEYLDTEMQTGFATQVGYFAKAVDSSAKVSDASNEAYIWVMPSAEGQYAYESRQLTPATYGLLPNSPNPFNPTTTIAYQLPEQSSVKLVIYNIRGERVRTLQNAVQVAGFYSAQWDGTNDGGQAVSTGTYLYHLVATSQESDQVYRSTRKMIYLR